MYRKVAAALVAALALGIAGCGGSEETLTRAQLARGIETACRQGQLEAQRQMRAARGPNAFIEVISAGQRAALDRIGDLNPPAAAKADFETLRDALQQRLEVLERLRGTGRAELQGALRSAEADFKTISRTAEGAQRRLMVTGCV